MNSNMLGSDDDDSPSKQGRKSELVIPTDREGLERLLTEKSKQLDSNQAANVVLAALLDDLTHQ